MTVVKLPDSPSGEINHGQVRAKTNELIDKLIHFGAFTNDLINVGTDPNNPTYLTNIALFPNSSPEFSIITDLGGVQWIKNNSPYTLSMQGTVTYQVKKGAGGIGEFKLWSERSDDDGVTFVENPFSLRTSEVSNNSDNSQTKSSGVDQWQPGQSIRWAMYNSGAGSIILDGPSDVVNGGNPIDGLSFAWQLNAVL